MVAQNDRDRSTCCPHVQVYADGQFLRERTLRHRQKNDWLWSNAADFMGSVSAAIPARKADIHGASSDHRNGKPIHAVPMIVGTF